MKRPYFFEIFALANLAVVALYAHESLFIVGSLILHFLTLAFGIALMGGVGVLARLLYSLVRRDRSYFDTIRKPGWLLDTLRLIAGAALIIVAYGWVKLTVPIYHPRLFDEELWDIDRILFLGVPPTTFFLDLFGARPFLQFIDWSYANLFYTSLRLGLAWMISHPDRNIRIAFANGNSALWMSGGWLYLLVPSLGPAYRFPDVWFAHSDVLQHTQMLQANLMRNYQNVLRAWNGEPVTERILLAFGIGAFPSLHVAFQTYLFLWARRLWRVGQVLFGTFALIILLGSMITGWHYLIDGVAGLAMAYLSYRICFPNHARNAGNDDPRRDPRETDSPGSTGAD